VNLSDLRPAKGAHKDRKIIGRGPGSGHGKTSTRGHKGDKARGQSKIGFEGGQTPLHRRLPKQRGVGVGLTARGFNSGRFKTHYEIVNLGVIESKFEAGATVGPDELKAKGLVRGGGLVKILAEGALTRKLTIRAHKFSGPAKAAIEIAGGTAEELS
jgi:large subunit ribosomal protein L15